MPERIAIVGSACRFPGDVSSPSEFWDLLQNPRDVLSNIPSDRLNLNRFYSANGDHHGATDVQGNGYLLSDDITKFDNSFFKINPKEAEGMDPQQRILLEVVYEAFESAGYSLEAVSGSQTSVHVGVMTSDYSDIQTRDSETLAMHHSTGTARSIISNRISYFFNLQGPSLTVDTACSSSLVALHGAVQSLRSGEAKSAIVAGANLILDTTMYIAESKLHMLSPDSRSRMWDKDANGYARGEGFAAIMLKPLDQAIADGDHIEAVIREVGVNSDGRSPKGITNPSSTAQTNLIRQTYLRAGLDPVSDRCDFFECHGTGTLAGDPVEARAIRDAFFPERNASDRSQPQQAEPLYVGSVKTVIGHTEGCAGLAGVLKATLALKHKTLPPNLLFNELNPAIRPFYENLEIVTRPQRWSASSSPMRASVNSFGFGGTNAHAIIESYENASGTDGQATSCEKSGRFIGPLVFSAHSESALVASVASFAEHIRSEPNVDLERLAYTLQTKRSLLGYKTFFSGASKERLSQFLERFAADPTSSGSAISGPRSRMYAATEEPGILGVFTGQGAQWASFGRGLLQSSPLFRDAIETSENTLAQLHDPPSWSLAAELMAEGKQSRVGEAAICQPLCTAVQIGMIAILRAAGIKLHAVVGHSSGEIAAAYAGGLISAAAAIQISYYRGFYAKLARGNRGQSGRMMAVGMSLAEASQFCSRPRYTGRIVVAASNSHSSVTLSGDEDAVNEAKASLDEQNIFARLLHTDTAYHSHHMLPCSEPYLKALKACNIQVHPPNDECRWSSSVFDEWGWNDLASLDGQYWVDNMCRPVLFSQAVEASLWHGGPFEVALEIGPHPALKGPAEQTFKNVIGHAPPYAGLMRRGENEIEAFSGAVGFVWRCLGSGSVDFTGYRAAFNLPKAALIKGLPRYAWDHKTSFWKESRISRRYRLHDDRYHELLGRRMPEDANESRRWRNILKLEEIPWLKGHNFQGQVLFPGAGYLVLALEAGLQFGATRPVSLIELEDVSLARAITLVEGSAGVEIIFSCDVVESGQKEDSLLVNFACSFCPDEASRTGPVRACTGKMRIVFSSGSSCGALPERQPTTPDMVRIDVERLRSVMADVGLDYRGMFTGMKCGSRSLGNSVTTGSWSHSEVGTNYKVHPAILDVAFQGLYAAFSSPASGDIWAPYLPVRIQRLSLSTDHGFTVSPSGSVDIDVEAFVETASSTLLSGDIHIYDKISQNPLLQVEGLAMQAMSEPAPENDKLIFSKTVWTKDILYGLSKPIEEYSTADDPELVDALNRVALHYWRAVLDGLSSGELARCKSYHKYMLATAKAAVDKTRTGEHPAARREWLEDTDAIINTVTQPYSSRADMRLLHVVGQNLRSVLTTDRHMLEFMIQDDLLNRFYVEGLGFSTCNIAICEAIQQIVAKNPHCKILEIGAGTGGTTSSIFSSIGQSYQSYTYTDISSGFFSRAAERFAGHNNMIFKVLDIEKDVEDQGFEAENYDIVIAANVLHATRTLTETMQNVRRLLKPGGHLVMMEITGLDSLWTPFIMGPLPGWWAGVDDGRDTTPAISELEWDDLLRRTGFSGVDHLAQDMQDEARNCFSMVVSQAIDPLIETIREPLYSSPDVHVPSSVAIIGGKTLASARLIKEIRMLLTPWASKLLCYPDMEALPRSAAGHTNAVISLQALDQPLFKSLSLTMSKMDAVKNLFQSSRSILWVSAGRLSSSPESNMTIGLGRAAFTEMPDMTFQSLDLDASTTMNVSARCIAEIFIRLQVAVSDSAANLVVEPELRVNNGAIYFPRVKEHTALNETYNSRRRAIYRDTSPETDHIELKLKNESIEASVSRTVRPASERNSIVLRVEYAMLLARNKDDELYLCSGNIESSGVAALTLSASNSSCLRIAEDEVVQIQESIPASRLASIGAALLIASIEETIPSPTGTIVFHECPAYLCQALNVYFSAKSTRSTFTTANSNLSSGNVLHIHPAWTAKTLKRRLPQIPSSIVDFSTTVNRAFIALKSATCPIIGQNDILTSVSSWKMTRVLQAATKNDIAVAGIDILRADTLATNQSGSLPSHFITDWKRVDHVITRVQPLMTSRLLSSCCTYLLMGMTGEMGLSISRWMAENGATHIAMASRNPKVSSDWLQGMSNRNIDVRVFAADVSNKASVLELQTNIRATMPRIAGIINGSMVLSDTLLKDMDADALNVCLQPKVTGSRNLDEIFGGEDLEFFVFLSSLATITGNAGQANYHAANMYMASLANQRREKGLAASVLHIGLVTDIGYVARRDTTLEDHLRGMYFLPLSETDLHHAFAEAILAGQPGSEDPSELILGLEPFIKSDSAIRRPPWESNPRLSHFIKAAQGHQTGQIGGEAGPEDLRQELALAETEEESEQIVQSHFCRKLGSIMQLAAESVNVNVPLIDLGCDSLLAIEIRSWFLKELQVDIPILKVLSGDTVADLCGEASRRVMASNIKVEKPASDKPKASSENKVPTAPHIAGSARQIEVHGNQSSQDGDCDTPSTSSASPVFTPLDPSEKPSDSVSIAESNITIPSSVEEKPRIDSLISASRGEACPTSHAQSRLWFLSKYLSDHTTYNVTVGYDISGPLDLARLQKALVTLYWRHTSLRTCFFEDEQGNPMQAVLSSPMKQPRWLSSASKEDAAQAYQRLRTTHWDLEEGYTFDVTILSFSAEQHKLIFGYHHIVLDGMSWYIYLRDLADAYSSKGLPPCLDCHLFSDDIRMAATNGKLDTDLRYWQDLLNPLPDVLPLLSMAQVSERKALLRYEHNVAGHLVGQQTNQRLRMVCQKLGATPFHFHLAIIQVMLFRFLDQTDLCIGIADANRTKEKYSNTVGFFLNLLPLRFSILQSSSFRQLLANTSRQVLTALSHSAAPFETILDTLKVPRSSKHSPLFQVAVNYRMGDLMQQSLGDCKLALYESDDAKNPYDLGFTITERTGGACQVELIAQRELYSLAAAEMLIDTYTQLLDHFVTDIGADILDAPLYSSIVAQKTVAAGKGKRVRFDWPQTLTKRFEDMAEQFANDTAIIDAAGTMSYATLQRMIYDTTAVISRSICTGEARVAVFCKPSRQQIVAMSAVLKAGLVYVPLDQRLPRPRQRVLIETCDAELILCDSSTLEAAKELQAGLEKEVAILDLEHLPAVDGAIPPAAINANRPAFLLFTSGSTGTPKGISLSQANFRNHIAAKTEMLTIGRETVLQQSSFGFDMSIIQTLCALLNGGKLVIAPSSSRGDPVSLAKLIASTGVTFTIATPSEYVMMLRYGVEHLVSCQGSWKRACFGGEAITKELLTEFQPFTEHGLRLTNCYGPTEITAAATFDNLSPDNPLEALPKAGQSVVGSAVSNYSVYILDHHQQLLPCGEVGEICIGGAGVAHGYIGDEALSRTKFLRDPYASPEDREQGWSTMYRTGDKGRLCDDGTLVFMGRVEGNRQVKLNGLRVELDDVAAHLLKAGQGIIDFADVSARGDPAYLVAFVLVKPGHTVSQDDLMQLARDLPLPQYMIPSVVCPLAEVPMTVNGKIDHKTIAALPVPEFVPSTTQMEGPARRLTLAEGELRLLWQKILPQSDSLGPDSDFFVRGGNSLLLVKMQAAIKATMSVSTSIIDLYSASTLDKMAELVALGKTQQAQQIKDNIDWESETAAVLDPRAKTVSAEYKPREHGRHVLMTGSTSFLGGAVLTTLLESEDVKSVSCIAVAPEDSGKLPRSDKIRTYVGSLTDPTLGLSDSDQASLAAEIDTIIHAGAVGHCLNQFRSLRASNLQSTKLLATFAAHHGIAMHYISSGRVTLLSGSNALPPISVRDSLPPRDGSEGFTASKWASERLLENFSSEFGLKSTVHRACAPVGPLAPSEDALNALLLFSRNLGVVPLFERFEGFLDFKDVGLIAQDIVKEALVSREDKSGLTRFVHHSSGTKVAVTELRRHLEEVDQNSYEEVDVQDWIDKALAAGLDPLIAGYLEAVVSKEEKLRFPYLGSGIDI